MFHLMLKIISVSSYILFQKCSYIDLIMVILGANKNFYQWIKITLFTALNKPIVYVAKDNELKVSLYVSNGKILLIYVLFLN